MLLQFYDRSQIIHLFCLFLVSLRRLFLYKRRSFVTKKRSNRLTSLIITSLLIIAGTVTVIFHSHDTPDPTTINTHVNDKKFLQETPTFENVYRNMKKNQAFNRESFTHSFLPFYPARSSNADVSNELDIPLILQMDSQWRYLKYGDDDHSELGYNGCALASLAMVRSYLENRFVSPREILDWSKEDYYVENEGTSWKIFSDFADEFNYKYEDHGENFNDAMIAVNEGKVVIASVKPGFSTNNGHILVIRGYQNSQVYVNDPADTGAKQFSTQGIDQNIILDKAINYWSFSK